MWEAPASFTEAVTAIPRAVLRRTAVISLAREPAMRNLEGFRPRLMLQKGLLAESPLSYGKGRQVLTSAVLQKSPSLLLLLPHYRYLYRSLNVSEQVYV